MGLRQQVEGLLAAHEGAGEFLGGVRDTLGNPPADAQSNFAGQAQRRFGDYATGSECSMRGQEKLIHTLPVPGGAKVAFSPDNRRLATVAVEGCRLWETGSWAPVLHIPPVQGDDVPGWLAFSPDGKMLAVTHRRDLVHLLNPATGELLAALEHPDSPGIISLSFTGDSSRLAVSGGFHGCLVWDLRAIRQGLKRIGIDWNAPAFAPERVFAAGKSTLLLIPRSSVDAALEESEQLKKYPPRDLGVSRNNVDLSLHYNVSLTNMPQTRHLSDDVTFFPTGLQSFAGVRFDVRGVVQLAGGLSSNRMFPREMNHISVGAKCSHLHFLHASMHGNSSLAGQEIGHYVVHYNKGQDQIIPIVYGWDMADWWSEPNQTPQLNSIVAWTGLNGASKSCEISLQLFKKTWTNPHPQLEVRDIDFVTEMTPASPFLIAITAEP